mmetsp:Transcript_10232/g.38774  ORF Transcript_10232/g.38774 Transcript_10232/m.38774 type:complete len:365 (-) Transcript_10232:41-1135(-)
MILHVAPRLGYCEDGILGAKGPVLRHVVGEDAGVPGSFEDARSAMHALRRLVEQQFPRLQGHFVQVSVKAFDQQRPRLAVRAVVEMKDAAHDVILHLVDMHEQLRLVVVIAEAIADDFLELLLCPVLVHAFQLLQYPVCQGVIPREGRPIAPLDDPDQLLRMLLCRRKRHVHGVVLGRFLVAKLRDLLRRPATASVANGLGDEPKHLLVQLLGRSGLLEAQSCEVAGEQSAVHQRDIAVPLLLRVGIGFQLPRAPLHQRLPASRRRLPGRRPRVAAPPILFHAPIFRQSTPHERASTQQHSDGQKLRNRGRSAHARPLHAKNSRAFCGMEGLGSTFGHRKIGAPLPRRFAVHENAPWSGGARCV